MRTSRFNSAAGIAAILLAVTWPLVTGAQEPAPRGGGGRVRGNGNTDYNLSLRSDADKALPNPYARNETWFKMPPGRKLGSSSAVDIDKDGKSVWVMERCGGQD